MSNENTPVTNTYAALRRENPMAAARYAEKHAHALAAERRLIERTGAPDPVAAVRPQRIGAIVGLK